MIEATYVLQSGHIHKPMARVAASPTVMKEAMRVEAQHPSAGDGPKCHSSKPQGQLPHCRRADRWVGTHSLLARPFGRLPAIRYVPDRCVSQGLVTHMLENTHSICVP